MDYILEADIYSECSQLDMMQYSLHAMGINEEEFIQEGINFDSIKEKVKKIGHSVVEFIKKARNLLGRFLKFIFKKSKVVDAATDAAEKRAEQAVDNMAKSEPEQAQAKARKACKNIMMITMNMNKQIEAKSKENSESDNTDSKAEIVPFNKGEVRSKGGSSSSNGCVIKVFNTQKIGEFLANAQQCIHGISSCIHDMDKIYKASSKDGADLDKLAKKDDALYDKLRNYQVIKVSTLFTSDVKINEKNINRSLVNTIMTQVKYVDGIQDRLEKIIKQSDQEYEKAQKKVSEYISSLETKTDEDTTRDFFRYFSTTCSKIRMYAHINANNINDSAQFIIKYKTTVLGYLSAIGAVDSANAA